MENMKAALPNVDIDHTLLPWVGRTAKLMMIYMTQQLSEMDVDLTPKQFIVLKHLMEKDGREQKQLAIITERDKTSLTRLITVMEKKGLVVRKVSETDKRSNRLFITDRGRTEFTKAIPIAHRSIAEFESGIDPKALETAINTIRQVHDHIKELTSQNQ